MNPNNKPDGFEEGALRAHPRASGLHRVLRAHAHRFSLRARGAPQGVVHRVSRRPARRAQRRQGALRHAERLRLQGRRRRRHHQRAPAGALVLGRGTQRRRRLATADDRRRIRHRDAVHALRRGAPPEASSPTATQQISLGKPGDLERARRSIRAAATSSTSWRSPPSACACRSTWQSSDSPRDRVEVWRRRHDPGCARRERVAALRAGISRDTATSSTSRACASPART